MIYLLKIKQSWAKNLVTSKRGFSIIEVLITITILGIVTSFAIIKFSSVKNRQSLDNATADIITTLNKASSKTLASVNSTTYGVHFEAGAIVVFTGDTYPGTLGASGNEPYISIVSPASITNVTLGGVSGSSGELYFNRLKGTPSKTGTITVTIPGSSRTITIGATGQISSS